MTSKVIFNANKKIKDAAMRRARKERTTLTSVLARAMKLYADDAFDPDDILTEEDIRAIEKAQKEVRRGKTYSLDEVRKRFRL